MTSPFPASSSVAAYFRDSGGDEQELSTAQQQAEFLKWCGANGHQPGRIFEDSARPGSTTVGREGFLEMIRYFRSGDAAEAGLVIWKYSRFSRDVDDAAFYRADLRRLGYTIHSLNDNIPDGPEGRFFEAAIDWMNQRFLEDLSVDVKRGLRTLVQAYGCVPGVPPRGFKRERVQIGTRRSGAPHYAHKWVPDPDLVPRVKQAFEMRAAGASLHQINQKTRLYGSLNSYRTFFTNRIYIGILEFGELTIENYCQPFVDMQIWNAVQTRVAAHAQARFGREHPRRANSPYLLSGLIFCARCGSPMFGNTVTRQYITGRDEAYRCSRSRRRRDCTAGRISARKLETAVLDTLREFVLLPENFAAIHALAAEAQTADEVDRKSKISANHAEQKKVASKIANITRAIADKGHSAALLDTLHSLEARQAELHTEHAQLEIPIEPVRALTDEQIRMAAGHLTESLLKASLDERRQILRGLVNKIVVEREGKQIRGMITYHYPPPFQLPLPETGEGAKMLPMSPSSVGAPRYRQHFTHPIIFKDRTGPKPNS